MSTIIKTTIPVDSTTRDRLARLKYDQAGRWRTYDEIVNDALDVLELDRIDKAVREFRAAQK